ncbi:MAG: HK97 family phage prohead protease [Bryobacteraceae bacterium]
MKNLTEFGSRLVTLNTGAQGLRGGLKCTVKEVEGDAPVMDFIASDETLDRYNEVIKLDGWQLDNFRANPVIPDCHDYSSITKILGRSPRIEVQGAKLVNRIEFCLVNPIGNLAYKMARAGFLKSESVGFIPLEWATGNAKDQPDRTYTKAELVEVSLVVVPANPGATIGMALKSGAITKNDISDLRDFLEETCANPTPKVRILRFKVGQKVLLRPESPKLLAFPYSEIGIKADGTVIATYTRQGVMDVEFMTDNFSGMLQGVSFGDFIPADQKDFCGEEAGPEHSAGASVAGTFDAQLLQLARGLNQVLRGA